MCERWRNSFPAFLADMGPRPSRAHSLDRINNSGNYEPGNCRWASRKEQANNTRFNAPLTHDGLTLTVAQWSDRTGLRQQTIHGRLHRGWSVQDTLTIPYQKKGQGNWLKTIKANRKGPNC